MILCLMLLSTDYKILIALTFFFAEPICSTETYKAVHRVADTFLCILSSAQIVYTKFSTFLLFHLMKINRD